MSTKQFFATILLTSAITYLLLGVLLGIAVVSGTSMIPNYHSGDIVLFSRVSSYDYGDVVVVNDGTGKNLIKRVIGLPGDTIYIEDGITYRNQERLDETYAVMDDTDQEEIITVPENSLYVLGDNRPVSADSRVIGVVSAEHVLGVVVNGKIT